MCSEPVSLVLQVAKVSFITGGRTRQLPFIPLFGDQVADQKLHQFTETWRVSTVIIIAFSIVSVISIPLLLICHHCLSSKAALKVSSNQYENLPPHFKCICHSRSLGEEVKQRFSAPVGLQLQTAILYVWCTWKGFCFSKNAPVLSDQTRLLMFPCVQSSWTSEHRTYLLWTVSSWKRPG